MSAPKLQRIRRKVEAGEPVSSEELASVEAAARQDAGPKGRLLLAHALINADEHARALPILDALRRDFPRDFEVLLGRARALLAAERYRDAQRDLEDARALNPGDPEAIKVLAILAMRQGERARAAELVAQALARDPFDGEARLVREELEAGTSPAGAPEPPATREEFTAALLAALRATRTRHARRGEDLLVAAGEDQLARASLAALYAAYCQEGKPLPEAARRIAASLASAGAGLPGTREELLRRVLPLLREADFIDAAGASVHREGPAGLLVYYAVEDPEIFRYVPAHLTEQTGTSLEDLDRAAWDNLARRLAEPVPLAAPAAPERVFALATGDGHDSARLLVPAQRQRMSQRAPPPWRLHLGTRELVLFCSADDEAASLWLARLERPAALCRLSAGGTLERA